MNLGGIYERAHEAADAIRSRVAASPAVGVVLGSGLGAFADRIEGRQVLPYAEIPHFPTPTVAGHGGNLVTGTIAGVPVAAFQGRFHHYEGHDLAAVTLPVRVLQALGVPNLILTAAVGALDERLTPGSIVAVTDHLNLIGANPLRGPNDHRLGTRFPDLSEVYSQSLRDIAAEEAAIRDIPLAGGVYAAMPGPCYETPAEIRMLRSLGADVVGMSTVPEAIVARHAGMRVLALAVVSNWAAGLAPTPITHQEVIEAGANAAPMLAGLLEGTIGRIGAISQGF